jgi:hypothetical protein
VRFREKRTETNEIYKENKKENFLQTNKKRIGFILYLIWLQHSHLFEKFLLSNTINNLLNKLIICHSFRIIYFLNQQLFCKLFYEMEKFIWKQLSCKILSK